jgi:NodT family efflux transporter outer membrane factor (OMF) lipoprotein
MSRLLGARFAAVMAMSVMVVSACGCTSLRDYYRNGFKVGPNYCRPEAAVAEHWIDAPDIRVSDNPEALCRWWTVFNDPKLNELVHTAYCQNLSLRQAGIRILEARATLDIAIGDIFPQQQSLRGNFARNAAAVGARSSEGFGIKRYSDAWNYGFSLNWELDFWGKFRRAIASANDSLDASVADYDYVLVTLLGDVASNYVSIRTSEERIKLLQANAELQREVLTWIEKRWKGGKLIKLDYDQALSNLRQTEAGIPQLEIAKRQAENALCVLLGMPTVDLAEMLGNGPIPTSPPEVAIGIPADLLRRRPDVRKAERLAAAQAELIGIAQADLYPAFSINGSMGYSAQFFPDLFRNSAFNGSVGPSFQWNVLNYGRIINNVRLQDAKFQELVVAYQNTVLTANKEVENGLVNFLRSQRRSKLLDESVAANKEAVQMALSQYKGGGVPGQPGSGDFNRYATIEQNLVTQQDSSAQARGQIAQGLIEVYRSLGGGWEIRLDDDEEDAPPMIDEVPPKSSKSGAPKMLEVVPTPIPAAPVVPKDATVSDSSKKPEASKEPELPTAPEPSKAPEPLKESVVAKDSDASVAPIIAKESELTQEAEATKGINLLRESVSLTAPETAKKAEVVPEIALPKDVALPDGSTNAKDTAAAKHKDAVPAKETVVPKDTPVVKEPTKATPRKSVGSKKDEAPKKAVESKKDVAPKKDAVPQDHVTLIPSGPVPLDPKKLIEPDA